MKTDTTNRALITAPRAVPNDDGTVTIYMDYSEDGRQLILNKKEIEELALILEALTHGIYINSYHWNGALTVEGGKGKDEQLNAFSIKELSGNGFCLNGIAEELVKKGRFTGARAWICIGEFGTMAKEEPVFWDWDKVNDDEENEEEEARGPQTSIFSF